MKDRDYIDAEFRVVEPDADPPPFRSGDMRDKVEAASYWVATILMVSLAMWAKPHLTAWVDHLLFSGS
jgi:hypothetical protein